MNHQANDESSNETEVSKAYQLLNQTPHDAVPPSVIDQKIKKAAAQSINGHLAMPKKRFIVPVSIAASILLASVVGLNLVMQDVTELQDAGVHVDAKKPMFMLQRSKPASAENMAVQLSHYLDRGEIDKARQLYKKMNYYFPEHLLNPELAERLRAENIL